MNRAHAMVLWDFDRLRRTGKMAMEVRYEEWALTSWVK